MAARGGSAPKLKRWEFPAKSGIRIAEVLNRSGGVDFGVSYQVTVPAKLAGTRKRKQFATQEEAETFAAGELETLRDHGREFQSLGPAEKREVAMVIDLLRPSGISLLEAAQFALKHMRPTTGDRTVQQVVNELQAQKKGWLESGSIRPKSEQDFRGRSDRFAEYFGDLVVRNLTLEDIKAWLRSLKLSGRSTKNYRMVAAEVMRYAQQRGYRLDNPLAGFTRADKRELEPQSDSSGREPAILKPSEAEHLVKTAFAHPELDLGAAVVLGLFCGIRTEELKRLQWDAVRMDEPTPFVKIDKRIAKKRRIRNVDIPANAVAWLRLWPKKQGSIARNAYATDFTKRFAKLTALAGFIRKDPAGKSVSTWNENAMRHSFGSYLYAATGDSLRTAAQLGHKASDQTLFDHYRALATKTEAAAYFSILPISRSDGVLSFVA